MSDQTPSDDADDGFDGADLLAAEYALGVLERDERILAERRSEQDPAFARAVFEWVVRLASLLDAVEAVQPPAALWSRIEAATAPLVPSTAPDGDPPRAANDAGPKGAWIWRVWAVGASALAAAALLFIALRPGGPGAPALLPGAETGRSTLVATLGLTAGGSAAMTVAYDPARSSLYVAPDADFSIPTARAAELWLIPDDGKPRPMGLIDPSKPATMPMPPEFRPLAKAKATLAISIEPLGGSPTGSPTGPVVATGKLLAV